MNTFYRINSQNRAIPADIKRRRFYRVAHGLLTSYGVADAFAAVDIAFRFAKTLEG
jgi:hypothetical protein